MDILDLSINKFLKLANKIYKANWEIIEINKEKEIVSIKTKNVLGNFPIELQFKQKNNNKIIAILMIEDGSIKEIKHKEFVKLYFNN